MKAAQIALLTFMYLASSALFGQQRAISEIHSLRLEFGAGFGDLYGNLDYNHPHSSQIEDLTFTSWTNWQSNLAYSFKVDFVEFELKIGYNYSSYYYGYTRYGGVANFTTTISSGTSSNSHFYVQPIGFNFGKERTWGNLFGGAYVRVNFAYQTSTTGTEKTDGWYWDGTTGVPVHTVKDLEPLIYSPEFSFGLQLGANVKIQQKNYLRLRLEINPIATAQGFPNYAQYIFNVGYSYVFKSTTSKPAQKRER